MLDPLVYGDGDYDDPGVVVYALHPADSLLSTDNWRDDGKGPRAAHDGAGDVFEDIADDAAHDDADVAAHGDADVAAHDDADDKKKAVETADDSAQVAAGNGGIDFANDASKDARETRDSASSSSGARLRRPIAAEMDEDDFREANEFEAMLLNQRRSFKEETRRLSDERKKRRSSEESSVSSVESVASFLHAAQETSMQSVCSSSSTDGNSEVDASRNQQTQKQLYSTPTSHDLDELCREARRVANPCICLMGVDELDTDTFQEWNALCLNAGDIRVVHMERVSQFAQALPCLCVINAAGRALEIQREWLLYMSHTRTLVQVHVLCTFDDSGALASVDELPDDCCMLVYDCENARCQQYMRKWVCNESSFTIHILRTHFPCSCIVHRVGEKLLVQNI